MKIDRIVYERWNPLPDSTGEKVQVWAEVLPHETPSEVLQTLRVWVDQQLEMAPKEIRTILEE